MSEYEKIQHRYQLASKGEPKECEGGKNRTIECHYSLSLFLLQQSNDIDRYRQKDFTTVSKSDQFESDSHTEKADD